MANDEKDAYVVSNVDVSSSAPATVSTRPDLTSLKRLVVFETPSLEALLSSLGENYPDLRLCPMNVWELPKGLDAGVTPVWFWTGSLTDLRSNATKLLREFVYPLVKRDGAYCIAFPFGSAELAPGELGFDSFETLDYEDIGNLLTMDAQVTDFALLPDLRDRMHLTPIEAQLKQALDNAGIVAKPHAKLGQYRVDLLVEHEGRKIGIEADGVAFHDVRKDRARDAALKALGVEEILRFSGSDIHHDARGCASTVADYLRRSSSGSARNAATNAGNLDRLDKHQRTAVTHIGGAARVLAPAGSGKTTIIVERVCELVRRGVPPASILILAFNKKAADQLISRLESRRVPVTRSVLSGGKPGVLCATFNAFGFRYQREVMGYQPTLATGTSRIRSLMSSAFTSSRVNLRSMKLKRGSDPIGDALKALQRVRAGLEHPGEISVDLESYGEADDYSLEFAPIYTAYERLQLATNVQSFDDQIYLTVRDLLAVPEHRQRIQQRFQHVLVDEFQDLNAAQLALVDILSRPNRNLFAVGDDDQLIYGWRFAKTDSILNFHEWMPPKPLSASYTLSTNYRSSRAVVETSRRLIDHNSAREYKDIVPTPDAPPGTVTFYRSDTWQDRANEVCRFLRREKAFHECGWRDLAVLCRYKAQQPLIAMALDANDIPRTPLLNYRLFTDRAARLLGAYLRLIERPSAVNGEDLAYVLNRPNRFLRKAAVQDVLESSAPWALVKTWASSVNATRQVTGLVEKVETMHAAVRRKTAVQLVDDVVREFALNTYWNDELQHGSTRNQDDADPEHVVTCLRILANDCASLTEFLEACDRQAERETAHLDMTDDTLVREESSDEDRLVIGTIHAAKGREYRAVVLLDYDADLSRNDIEAERRVMYVGVTRARNSLLLTLDGNRDSPHPFFQEMIEPVSGEEATRLRREFSELKRRERALVDEQAHFHAELQHLDQGRQLQSIHGRVQRLIQQQEALNQQMNELLKMQQTGGLTGFLQTLTGQRVKAMHEYQAARERRDSLQTELDQA